MGEREQSVVLRRRLVVVTVLNQVLSARVAEASDDAATHLDPSRK